MVRITHTQSPRSGCMLAIEGRLVGPWVTLLRRECRKMKPTSIDLAGVVFIDAAGLDLLRRLSDEGIELVAASAFVTGLLQTGIPS